jgi:DNA replication protein DnaC
MARLDLLIIDRVGFIRKKDEYASLLLELISACQDRVSIITTSNISIEEWGQAFGSISITNDIVDRLFHKASILNVKRPYQKRILCAFVYCYKIIKSNRIDNIICFLFF